MEKPEWMRHLYENVCEKPPACRGYLLKLINDSNNGLDYERMIKKLLSSKRKKDFMISFGGDVGGDDVHNASRSLSLKEILKVFEDEKLIVRGFVGKKEKYLITSKGIERIEKYQELIDKYFID